MSTGLTVPCLAFEAMVLRCLIDLGNVKSISDWFTVGSLVDYRLEDGERQMRRLIGACAGEMHATIEAFDPI